MTPALLTLALDLIRDGKPAKVAIQLEAIGRFSDTFPKNCRKSETLAARAVDYLNPQTGGAP